MESHLQKTLSINFALKEDREMLMIGDITFCLYANGPNPVRRESRQCRGKGDTCSIDAGARCFGWLQGMGSRQTRVGVALTAADTSHDATGEKAKRASMNASGVAGLQVPQ